MLIAERHGGHAHARYCRPSAAAPHHRRPLQPGIAAEHNAITPPAGQVNRRTERKSVQNNERRRRSLPAFRIGCYPDRALIRARPQRRRPLGGARGPGGIQKN
jgi:hypothetical protein